MNDTVPAKKSIPKCIGIIMDGNRRWAKKNNLPKLEGHRAGYKKFKEVSEWVKEEGVKNVIYYAFSTENWNRGKDEVSYLEKLIEHALLSDVEKLMQRDFRLRILGQVERFSKKLQKRIIKVEEKSKNNTYTIGIALSYGGRADILQAVNKLIKAKNEIVTEESVASCLWTHDIPDPDLIIRPGSERRLSNFLTWQSVYSELFFVDTLWPDFGREEFSAILHEYAARKRRYGRG